MLLWQGPAACVPADLLCTLAAGSREGGGEFCCVLTVGRPLPLLACLCSGEPLRALARTDFEKVLEQFTPPSRAAQAARARLGNGTAAAAGANGSSSGVDGDSMQLVAAALRAMLMGAADGAVEA